MFWAKILAGGQAAMNAEGVVVIGGHSVDDQEMKFGYAVTGVVRSRPGDNKCRSETRRCFDPDKTDRHRCDKYGGETWQSEPGNRGGGDQRR